MQNKAVAIRYMVEPPKGDAMGKRIFCLLVLVLMLCVNVFAFEAPAWLTQMREQGIQGEVTGELNKFSPFSGKTFNALKDWTKNSNLSFQVSEKGQAMNLSHGGHPLLSFRKDDSALYLSATSQEYVGENALERLLDMDPIEVPDVESHFQLYEAVFAALERTAVTLMPSSTEHKKSVELKNIGQGYRGNESTMDLTTVAILREELTTALREKLPLSYAMHVDELLDKFTLTKDGTFRTLLNSGEVVGYQLRCKGEFASGDERDISLLFARSAKGVDIRVTLPDANKENNLIFNLSVGLKKTSISVDAIYSKVVQKKEESNRVKVSLNFQDGLQGSITCTINKPGEKTLTYKISPVLAWKEEALSGRLTYTRTQNDRSLILKLYPILRPLQEEMPQWGTAAINLDALDAESMAFERERVRAGLSSAVLPLVSAITPDDQMLVMHELTRHLRLAPKKEQANPWLVQAPTD